MFLFDTEMLSELPSCMFRCHTLIKIELKMAFAGCTLKFPHSISLSSLRISSLRYVTFMDDESTSNLLSSLSLEELLVRNCSLKNLKQICIAAPNIWHMAILSNVCHLQIQGVNLRRFSYSGRLLDEYSFVDSSIESS